MDERYAIHAAGKKPIFLPEGCALHGARRHACEYSIEVDQPVTIYRVNEEGLLAEDIGTVESKVREWPRQFTTAQLAEHDTVVRTAAIREVVTRIEDARAQARANGAAPRHLRDYDHAIRIAEEVAQEAGQ